MTKPRPCGCKGCRTCLICETHYGAEDLKLKLEFEKERSYVFCPHCNKAWKGWDINLYKQHPNHEGESIDYPGVYIQLDFLSEEEANNLMADMDDMPWDISQSGRRKQNFGPKTNFKKKKAVLGNFDGYPECTKFIQDRFESVDILKGYETVEQCSLEYDPNKGAAIDPHIDDCWIWGERIVTVNCLADTILTFTLYEGDKKKYNMDCADEYRPVVTRNGQLIDPSQASEQSALQACAPAGSTDIIVRIPMIWRSLAVLYGEPRYHWEHCILREDITTRRVCIAYRELTPPYLDNGPHENIGREIRNKAKTFWNHKEKYNQTIKD